MHGVHGVLPTVSIAAVLQKCRDHDRELLDKGVPAVQDCLSRASCGLADCEKTAETLEHWYIPTNDTIVILLWLNNRYLTLGCGYSY